MSEPNSKFPKVSSCHGAPLRVDCSDDLGGVGTCCYICTELTCNQPCDAVPDEGLEEKKEVYGEKCPYRNPDCPKDYPKPLPPPDAKEENRKIIQISASRGADGVPIVFALDNSNEVWIHDKIFRSHEWHKLPNLPPLTPPPHDHK